LAEPALKALLAAPQADPNTIAARCSRPVVRLYCANRVWRIATYHFPALKIQTIKTSIVAISQIHDDKPTR
jgi:hypothetical protein